ncbi:MAG: arylesterase [Burkholderiaceae bacterium]|nr:arylesterase [Burkholderiaceae bacterium]
MPDRSLPLRRPARCLSSRSPASTPAGRCGRRSLLRLLAGCATAASLPGLGRAAPRGPEAARTLLLLGDSLSAEYGLRRGSGWVELLSRRLAARRPPRQVVNASISGETTAGGDSRIVELLARHRPAVVVIELGGNDALRGLDLSATEANLADIARAARRSGARVLLLGMQVPPNYGRPYADAFAALFRRVAEREKASLLPFFLDGVAERPDLFQPDRIHPNEKAQQRLLDNVWPALRPLLD